MAQQEGQQQWYREVTGYDGTFEEAVEEGIIEKPARLTWNAFQTWRTDVGMRPSEAVDGPPPVPNESP